MKKEEQISVSLAALFAYSVYRWSASLFYLFSDGVDYIGFFHVSLIILLIGIAGLIQFYSSGYKKSQLLRLYLIYDLVGALFGYVPGTVRVLISEQSSAMFIHMVVETLGIAVGFYALSVLAQHRTPKVQESRNEDGSVALHYVPVSKGTRFLNRFLDTVLLVFIIKNSYGSWDFLMESTLDGVSDVAMFMIFILLGYVLSVVYFLLMEYNFHTSFGKVLTQTTVINAQGGYPSLSTTLTRSLCRLIPFDSLSFFGDKGGWHDRLSNTGVVEDKYVD